MKYRLRIKLCISLLAIITITLFFGCSSQKINKNETDKNKVIENEESIDFSKKLDLKKSKNLNKENPTILFIGNSHTYVNDLPSIFEQLSKSGGINADVYDITQGRYTLKLFSDNNDEMGEEVYYALNNYYWDYVILQEHSRVAILENVEDNMYEPARKLDKLIKESKAETVFLMTWAYKNGDITSEGNTDLDKRKDMQQKLADSYIKISKELDSILAPAGIAWMRCVDQYPEIELWDEEDLMHPSLSGTYLTACTLYGSLYNKSPIGLQYYGDLDKETAEKLQKIAEGVIFQE